MDLSFPFSFAFNFLLFSAICKASSKTILPFLHFFLLGIVLITSSYIGEKAMAPHSSTLAWEIPWTEETGRLQSMWSLSWTQLNDFICTFHFHALEKEMATLSSALAWRIPRMGAWWADIYGVAQSRTQLTWLRSSSSFLCSVTNLHP